MKKFLLLAAAIAGIAAVINARIDAARVCGCQPECWCKQPRLRLFRWVLPFRHTAVSPEWKQHMEPESLD